MILGADLNPVIDVLDSLGGLPEAAGNAVFDSMSRAVFTMIANAVASVTEAVISVMQATTGVDLDGAAFSAMTPIRRTVLGMSTALILALFLLAVIRALAAGEPSAIIKAALVDVPAAVLTSVGAVSVAWLLIQVVDQASVAVTGDVGAAMGQLSASLTTAETMAGAGLLGILFGLLFIVGAVLVWLQLLVRSGLLYIVVVLAPLGLATRAHPATRPIARRTLEMLIALILSKFAIAVAFGVGSAAMASSNTAPAGDTVELRGMMAGVAVMLLAAFMPWVIWKAIPVVAAASVTAGVERAPAHGANAAVSLAAAAGFSAARLAGGGSGSSITTGALPWNGLGPDEGQMPLGGRASGPAGGGAAVVAAGGGGGALSGLGREAGVVPIAVSIADTTSRLRFAVPADDAADGAGGTAEGTGQRP